MHNTNETVVTCLVILGGGLVAVTSPESHHWVVPIISAFAGSWLRMLVPTNGNGNGNGK